MIMHLERLDQIRIIDSSERPELYAWRGRARAELARLFGKVITARRAESYSEEDAPVDVLQSFLSARCPKRCSCWPCTHAVEASLPRYQHRSAWASTGVLQLAARHWAAAPLALPASLQHA